MKNVIRKIVQGDDLEEIFAFARDSLLKNGPSDAAVLEALAYLKIYQEAMFAEHEGEILELMGTFYKESRKESLLSLIFELYAEAIEQEANQRLTPVQYSMLEKCKQSKYFSFSAPTSTGKSFVFRNLIRNAVDDVAVIVPSRALINEYYDQINLFVDRKSTNVLTFVDRINTARAKRNIFILTPERARELFKHKYWLRLDFVLFDEAQLSDDSSARGLYFDSIVRRIDRVFPDTRMIFAHPFVSNPEAQLVKNNLDEDSCSQNYEFRNVGQIFYAYDKDNGEYYHFGSKQELLGRNKLIVQSDPVRKTIMNNGSVFIYTSKASIYSGEIFEVFKSYIDLCAPTQDETALEQIELLRSYLGATSGRDGDYYSKMIEFLKRGIVIHHGSIPLTARSYLERFVQSGYCRMCFATSTLEQGVNMPFDLVFLWRFDNSKPLTVKNLIGRAGRSTVESKFDYGSVVVKKASMGSLRKILASSTVISDVSRLDVDEPEIDEKYQELKEAINEGSYSDEYNLTPKDLKSLSSVAAYRVISEMLQRVRTSSELQEDALHTHLSKLYSIYLGRDLSEGEENVFKTAVRIMLLRWKGLSFHDICRHRFARVARLREKRELQRDGNEVAAALLPARFEKGYSDIPDAALVNFPLYSKRNLASEVDYDRIVFDTYDYLDQLIGFKLSDLFYAAFKKYSDEFDDRDALRIALLFKYGTSDNREIWMLRYGFDFDDFEWLAPCIESISEEEISFNSKIELLTEEQREMISPYV